MTSVSTGGFEPAAERPEEDPARGSRFQAGWPSLRSAIAVGLSVSRLHIVAIAALGCFTFGWIFTGIYVWSVCGVCALDWFLVNLLNRAVDSVEDLVNGITGAEAVARQRRVVVASGLSLLAVSLVLLHMLMPELTILRVGYHLLGVLYNWRLLPGGRRIKELYFWKNTASATGFLITVFGYPLAHVLSGRGGALEADITLPGIGLAGLFFFLFELSYEVIYDLRDRRGDEAAGVSTYAVVHGERGAVRIIDALLVGSMAVLVGAYLWGQVPWRLAIMAAAPLIQLILYKRALRRGIRARDCITLTWLGAALLAIYHLWVVLDLPGARLP